MWESKKARKVVRIAAVTGAVYGVFRFLLPLAAPFLFAWVTSILLKPSAYWLSGRLKVVWRGHTFCAAPGVMGMAELVVLMTGLGAVFYLGGRKLYQEAVLLAENLPSWIHGLDRCLTEWCYRIEGVLSVRHGLVVPVVQDMIRGLFYSLKEKTMPYLMGNSVAVAGGCVKCGIAALLYLVGVTLFLQESDCWNEKIKESVFQEEFQRLFHVLKTAANAYLRTQGIIMMVTALVCTAGFFLMGNPYAILAGLGIGIVDALPIFGTGTVLIPWAAWNFLGGNWGKGAAVLAIYGVCYLLREILEPKLMGDKVGLSPLETLISMYVGLGLFGVFGVLLGPVGLMIIKEFA